MRAAWRGIWRRTQAVGAVGEDDDGAAASGRFAEFFDGAIGRIVETRPFQVDRLHVADGVGGAVAVAGEVLQHVNAVVEANHGELRLLRRVADGLDRRFTHGGGGGRHTAAGIEHQRNVEGRGRLLEGGIVHHLAVVKLNPR